MAWAPISLAVSGPSQLLEGSSLTSACSRRRLRSKGNVGLCASGGVAAADARSVRPRPISGRVLDGREALALRGQPPEYVFPDRRAHD